MFKLPSSPPRVHAPASPIDMPATQDAQPKSKPARPPQSNVEQGKATTQSDTVRSPALKPTQASESLKRSRDESLVRAPSASPERSSGAALPAHDPDDEAMMLAMGFSGFGTTKYKPHANIGGKRVEKTAQGAEDKEFPKKKRHKNEMRSKTKF